MIGKIKLSFACTVLPLYIGHTANLQHNISKQTLSRPIYLQCFILLTTLYLFINLEKSFLSCQGGGSLGKVCVRVVALRSQ